MSFFDYESRVRWIIHNKESLKPNYQHRFLLYKTIQPFIRSNGRINLLETTPRPEFVNREVTPVVPATGSLLGQDQEIIRILTNMGIPQGKQPEILQKIEDNARQPLRCATMEVRILAVTYQEYFLEDYDVARAERESMEQEIKPIPATHSSIDALERLVFNGLGSSSMDCMVCMAEIESGVEVIRMPCHHVYHSNCIVQWLQTSHLCPLCRYHMPCDF